MINGKQPRFHTFLLGFDVSIKSTKIPLSSFGQRIYITRISINCCYTLNCISRKVPLFSRCICDLSLGSWRVLQLICFVCEQGNLTLQLQHPECACNCKAIRKVYWSFLTSTKFCLGGKWATYLRPYPNPYLKRLPSCYSRLVGDGCPDGFS